MSFASDWETYSWPGLLEEFGGTAATIAHGSTSFAVTSCIKKDERRERDLGDGLDYVVADFLVLTSDMDSGFVPSPGLTVTDADSVVWTCGQGPAGGPRRLGQGAAWALPCSRRVGRGKA